MRILTLEEMEQVAGGRGSHNGSRTKSKPRYKSSRPGNVCHGGSKSSSSSSGNSNNSSSSGAKTRRSCPGIN